VKNPHVIAMAMTRRDFITVAQAIYGAPIGANAKGEVAAALLEPLRGLNANFDKSRFFKAATGFELSEWLNHTTSTKEK